MGNFSIEVPCNALGYGQVGFGVLRELFNRNLTPNIFFIGAPDLKPFIILPGFVEWLNFCSGKAETEFSENEPAISLWHLQGSHKRISSKKNILWTAHETDFLTDTEANIANKFDKILLTSNYSKQVFSSKLSEQKLGYCPNFYDDLHFFKTNRQYRNSAETITFGLYGKLEHRKQTLNTMVAWSNLYAGNKDYRLCCYVYNPFVPVEIQSNQIMQVFRGQKPWNVEIYPFQETNVAFNDAMNNTDIDLTGLSSAEGFNLPVFHSLCLGKQAVVLNAHAHKDFANSENSILVEPEGTQEIYDGQFFVKGARFNQGNMSKWSMPAAQKAMQEAVLKAKQPNLEGEKLKDTFSLQRSVDILLSEV